MQNGLYTRIKTNDEIQELNQDCIRKISSALQVVITFHINTQKNSKAEKLLERVSTNHCVMAQ
jgi:hypothetical protein